MDKRKNAIGFYESVRRTLFVCRIAGYLPVIELLNENSKFSRSLWISKYTIYHGITLVTAFVFAFLHFYHILYTTDDETKFAAVIFRCFAIIVSLFLIVFCMRWEKMIKDIEDIERLLPPFKHPERIIKNINCIMLSILGLFIVTHVIYLILAVPATSSKWNNLSWIINTAIWISHTQMLFACSFTDCLVIVVTLYLIYRFVNFNRLVRIRQGHCLRNRNIPWMDLQAHYTRLTRLVKTVDDYINPFVFLSFLSNMIFMCDRFWVAIQMLKHSSSDSQKYSRLLSTEWNLPLSIAMDNIILILRASTVFILTTHLHNLSREPLKLLHELPDAAYTSEVQRFLDQVFYSKIWLTGFGLFHVSMETIRTVVEKIFAYELVLLQQ